MILLGTITCPAGTAKNNTSTAVPFVIPLSVREISLLTQDADITFEVKVDNVNPSLLVTSAATGRPLVAGAALDGIAVSRFGYGAVVVLCAFNAGGGSEAVEVWASRVS